MIINIEIVPKPYEPIEKTIKRFSKKCKKENIIKDVMRYSFFETKRQKEKRKQLKKKFQEKKNKKRN